MNKLLAKMNCWLKFQLAQGPGMCYTFKRCKHVSVSDSCIIVPTDTWQKQGPYPACIECSRPSTRKTKLKEN